jgi:hypothetical protein
MPGMSFVRRLQSQLLRFVQLAFQRGKTSSNGQGILGGDTIAPEDIAAGPSPRFGMRAANAGRKFGFCHSHNLVSMSDVPVVDALLCLPSFAPCQHMTATIL